MNDIEEETKGRKDEKMEHSAVVESSLEEQIRESTNYTCIVRENWSPSHSGTRTYGRQAVRQTNLVKQVNLNSVYLTFKYVLDI